MNISLIILGIVLGSILTIVLLIFAILSLANGKGQNAIIWGVSFAIAISVLLVSVVSIVRRIGQTVKSGVEWAKDQEGKHLSYNGDSDNADYYKQERQDFLDSLKKYTNEKLKDKVPDDFYTNKKAKKIEDSKIIVPFVYPLSIKFDTYSFLGDIISDANDSVYLQNVSQMAFDENFAIAKVDNTNDEKLLKEGRGEIEYVLFDLRTREYLTFTSEKQLLEKSEKIGYSGTEFMATLSDSYRGWIDTLNFDF